jgi:hypothetical protein
MKTDGQRRCYLKGPAGDAANAILVAVGLQFPPGRRLILVAPLLAFESPLFLKSAS